MTSFGENLVMRKKLLGILSVLCVLMFTACAPQKPEEVPEEIIEEETTVVEEVVEETTTVSTLTGLPVTEEIRKEYSGIPWKAAAGMRDITAHTYQTLRREDVYTTVKEDFVVLKEQLKEII